MKLLLFVTCENAFSEAPRTAYLELAKEHAAAILKLVAAAVEFRKAAGADGLASEHYMVSVGSGSLIPDFRLIEVDVAGGVPEPELRQLPDDFDPNSVDESKERRVECHRILIDEEKVEFTALDKHGSDCYSTAYVPTSVLQAIAATGTAPLPMAVIAMEETA